MVGGTVMMGDEMGVEEKVLRYSPPFAWKISCDVWAWKYVEPWPVASAILSVWGRRRRPPARREERPPSRRRGGRPDDRRPRSAEAWRPKRFPNTETVVGGVGVFLCWKCLEMPAATWTFDKDPRQGRRRRVKRGPRSDSRVRIPRVPDSSRYESLGDVNLYEVQEMT